MLGTKLTLIFAVTLLVLSLTEDNEVNAAPEPCREMMNYYYPFKKPEKSTKSKDDKAKTEKDKKKELLQKLQKMFEKMLGLEDKASAANGRLGGNHRKTQRSYGRSFDQLY